MHTWHWQTWEGLPYLTCSILEPWAHGFFTQQFWSRSPAELVEVLQPTAEVYRVKQVHGNVVLTPSEITQTASAEESLLPADGVVTEQAVQSAWVASADCTPVLIADAHTGQVAAVHAGWRGTAAKIVTVAIARLQAQGSQLSDLRIALGPAISGAVYQVSTQVAAQVGATVHESDDEELILNILQRLPDAPILPDPEPGRVRLDVRRTIALQLEYLGINPEQVAIAPYCTYQEPQCFFSYRRDRKKKVQWSGIVSKKAK
ncbi:peptidoglycan editing factor PgeF [Gloeocapsopsis sp. IPPAS B-1203]|uniref:peptidoglycan editing factor PgeF n=1 Tax=Gloeocapsopsis sp. IPPAS B-1203 TaxID=2049454 RepID=UPI000C185B31|nr:peptidoglycan editing factor PgeF [Gloeocapsopsis sp. IPPAS B-1203]PIG94945.1 laccase [Gloeocapsopsis sp. IPPAS B-1203]